MKIAVPAYWTRLASVMLTHLRHDENERLSFNEM